MSVFRLRYKNLVNNKMAPLLLHLREELLEAHLLDRKFEEVFEEYAQTTYLILNQCYVAMQEGQKILQEFGVLLY